jgi:hypothetical protein
MCLCCIPDNECSLFDTPPTGMDTMTSMIGYSDRMDSILYYNHWVEGES